MFEGVYTAIVTPFCADGSVDYERLRALLEFQVAEGVDGVVPVGTTGESPTLNFEEHHKVIETAIDVCNGRVKVIAGTGGNSTDEALRLTKHAKEAGADGSLQVTPYYNKPTQQGLIRHFSAVADIGLPIILYNIPGRTGLSIDLETVQELARHPNIVAVKEAGGSVDRVSYLARLCDLEILSGDDALTLPMMLVGGVGVISVTSNVAPARVCSMVHAALRGAWAEARTQHGDLHRLFCDLFMATNPIPVKAALAMMGRIEEVYRLPLVPLEEDQKRVLRTTLEEYGLV